jgi:dihydroorotase
MILDAAHRGQCTYEQVVQWMCETPAKLYRMKGRGVIQAGAFADLALVDLKAKHTIRNEEQLTKCKWSPWDGKTVTGRSVTTVVNGEVAFEDGVVCSDLRGHELQFEPQ